MNQIPNECDRTSLVWITHDFDITVLSLAVSEQKNITCDGEHRLRYLTHHIRNVLKIHPSLSLSPTPISRPPQYHQTMPRISPMTSWTTRSLSLPNKHNTTAYSALLKATKSLRISSWTTRSSGGGSLRLWFLGENGWNRVSEDETDGFGEPTPRQSTSTTGNERPLDWCTVNALTQSNGKFTTSSVGVSWPPDWINGPKYVYNRLI